MILSNIESYTQQKTLDIIGLNFSLLLWFEPFGFYCKLCMQGYGSCIAILKSTPAGVWKWLGLYWMENFQIRSCFHHQLIFQIVNYSLEIAIITCFLLCFLCFYLFPGFFFFFLLWMARHSSWANWLLLAYFPSGKE